MRNRSGKTLVAVIAALCGVTGTFVLTTVVMDTIADTVIVGLMCAVAFVIVLATQGASGISQMRRTDRTTLGIAALGGSLAFWAAPLMTLSQRASDAPSGADTLFFTTSMWGLTCVALAFSRRSERPPLTSLAGAVAAAAGAAGLLASWEYPSSFSPFAKFPVREALMLAAGVLFAAGALALAQAARRAGPRVALAAGLGGSAVLGMLVALPGFPTAQEIGGGALLPCLYLGVALAVFAFGWIQASAQIGVSRTSVSLMGAPVIVMALAGVERVTNVYGPNPIAWPAALAGAAVIVAGMSVVWLAEPAADSGTGHSRPRSARWALGFAVGAFVLATAALATPALDAVSEGGVGEPFRAAWTMVGAESATGWLAVAAAGLALASVLVARAGAPVRSWAPSAVSVLVCVLAAIPLLGATLHTWNRWVPAEVQQTYGTEYSRLVVEPHIDPVRVTAMLLAVVAVAVLALTMRRGVAPGSTSEEDMR